MNRKEKEVTTEIKQASDPIFKFDWIDAALLVKLK
jgi:hypothetical protein